MNSVRVGIFILMLFFRHLFCQPKKSAPTQVQTRFDGLSRKGNHTERTAESEFEGAGRVEN